MHNLLVPHVTLLSLPVRECVFLPSFLIIARQAE